METLQTLNEQKTSYKEFSHSHNNGRDMKLNLVYMRPKESVYPYPQTLTGTSVNEELSGNLGNIKLKSDTIFGIQYTGYAPL